MEPKRKILVTGSNGQLGQEIRERAKQIPNVDFVFTDRNDMPLDDPEKISHILLREQPDVVINCAAYTAVDAAEQDKDIAFQVNATAVGQIAGICHQLGCRFLHVSTDYVFNGKSSHPYSVTDSCDPINVYGASKRKGEELALAHHPESIIIRTSWVYSRFGKNFVKTIAHLLRTRSEIRVVNDQIGSPTSAADLAEALCVMALLPSVKAGIYHFTNDGVISWYDFAMAIKEFLHTSCVIHPVPSSEYPTPAARPSYSVLDTRQLHHECPMITRKHWKASLETCLAQIP